MESSFGRFMNWRLLMILAVLALLLALTLATNLVVLGPQPDAAEIDGQVQQMDAPRFNLSNYSTAPMIDCPRGTACPD